MSSVKCQDEKNKEDIEGLGFTLLMIMYDQGYTPAEAAAYLMGHYRPRFGEYVAQVKEEMGRPEGS